MAKLELEMHQELVFGKDSKRYFKDMLGEYLAARANQGGLNAFNMRKQPLVAFFADCDASRMKEVDVEKYCSHRGKQVKAETVRRDRCAFSGLQPCCDQAALGP